MEISNTLYESLRQPLDLPPLDGEETPRVPNSLADSLANGHGIIEIIQQYKEVTPPQLQQGNSVSARLHNWKALAQTLSSIGVRLDNDTKSLLVAGDQEALIALLARLSSTPKVSVDRPPEGGVYIDSLDTSKPLMDTESCLEFLIVSFCQHFSLNPKQATGLMAQGNRYLAHIIVKGLKNNYDPINRWFQDLYTNSSHITELISLEPESMSYIMEVIKPGYISKDREVVEWAFRITSKLFLEFSESDLLEQAYTWFVSKEQSPLSLTVHATRKFAPDIYPLAVDLYLQASNYLELFSEHIRRSVEGTEEYITLVCDFIPLLAETEQSVEDIGTSGLIGHWIELGIRSAEQESMLTSMHFLTRIITHFYSIANAPTINSVLSLLNRVCRNESLVVRSEASSLMFHMLDFLIEKENSYAGVCFRAVTFLLVESFESSLDRESLESNFSQIFQKHPQLPLGILLDPLIKRLSLSDIELNVFDLSFFMVVSKHPSLSVRHAVMLADMFGRFFLNDLIFAKGCGCIFSELAYRFLKTEQMQEFLFMFARYTLNIVLNTEQFNVQFKRNKKSFTLKETRMMEELRQQRNLILNMLCWILQQWDEELNHKITGLLVEHKNAFREATDENCESFYDLLELVGRPKTPPKIQTDVELFVPEEEDVEEEEPSPKKNRQVKKAYFPWERANGDIERAKLKYSEKQEKNRKEAEKKLREFEAQQRKVQRQLEIRKLEQGRARDEVRVNLYSEGLAAKYISSDDIELKEFSKAEQDDWQAVQLLLKKYSRVFVVWFQNYSGTGFERKKHSRSDFDWLASRKERLNEAEFIKLLIEHGVIPRLISKEELKSVMKAFCMKVLKQPEQSYVNYEGFKELVCQLAWFIYSKPKHDYSHLPPVFGVKALLDHVRSFLKLKNMSTEIYDEPDPGTGDKDVVKKLNKMLRQDPNTSMPEGYTKVTDIDMALEYALPKSLHLPESYAAAYEALDYILYNRLGIHLIEPQIKIKHSYRAKGIKPKREVKELPPIYERSSERVLRTRSPVLSNQNRIGNTADFKISPELKYLVALSSDQTVTKECALVLEDVLSSIQLRMTRVINRTLSKPQVEDRSEDIARKKEKEKLKMARRQQELQEQLARAKADREAKLKAQAEKRVELDAKEESRRQILAERSRQEKLIKKKILEDYHKKKLIEGEEKKREEEEKSKRSREIKQREMEEFKKKNTEAMKRLLRETSKKHSKSVETHKPQLKILNKNNLLLVNEVLRNKHTRQMFDNNRNSINEAYKFYSGKNGMDLEGFQMFCLHFAISPQFITTEDVKMFYASKRYMSFSEFEEAFVFIAAKGKNKLHKLHGENVSSNFNPKTVELLFKQLNIEQRLKENITK